MELWENEVYRFKTIGQLKVGHRRSGSPWGFLLTVTCSAVSTLLTVTCSAVSTLLTVTCSAVSAPQAISQYLPRGDLRLRPAIYEMILHECLKTDYEVAGGGSGGEREGDKEREGYTEMEGGREEILV